MVFGVTAHGFWNPGMRQADASPMAPPDVLALPPGIPTHHFKVWQLMMPVVTV